MWVMLLDRSGSMSEPFRGEVGFAGRTRTVDASVKLDAAISELRRHLRGLRDPEPVEIISFNDTATSIFRGMSSEDERIAAVLTGVKASGTTSVAAALDLAFDVCRKAAMKLVRVVVISDGLSDPDRARRSAEQLAEVATFIDVLLIDPTPDGEALARAIAVKGRVEGITTAVAMREAIGEIADEHAQARVAHLAMEVALHRAEAAMPPPDRLRIAAGHSSVITAEWSPLHILLHTARNAAEVQQRLALALAETPYRTLATAESTLELAQGTVLRLVPQVDLVEFDPIALEVAWHGGVQPCDFRMRSRAEGLGRTVSGMVDILVRSLPVASVPINVSIGPNAGAPMTAEATVSETLFASYAHVDRDIVRACVAAYEALGMTVFLDEKSLRSGQHWPTQLRYLIDQSDIFQLYWSSAAHASKNVEAEWRYALEVREKKKPTFLRPVVWEEMWPSPPAELEAAKIHFARLDLDWIRGISKARPVAVAPQPAGIPSTVVPLLRGVTDAEVRDLEAAVGEAVGFLEDETLLRYYPVPTLLVDDYAVKSIRRQLVPGEGSDDAGIARVRAWTEVAGNIACDFHVAFSSGSLEDQRREIARAAGLTDAQFETVRQYAEHVIGTIVEQSVAPSWRKAFATGGAECFSEAVAGELKPSAEVTELQSVLRKYDRVRPNAIDIADDVRRSDVARTETLLDRCAPVSGKKTFGWQWSLSPVIRDTVFPIWRQLRADCVAVSLEGFADDLNGIACLMAFVRHLLACLRAEVPPRLKKIELTPATRQIIGLELDRLDNVLPDVFARAAEEILAALARLASANTREEIFITSAPSYGIFIPAGSDVADRMLAEWARDRAIAPEMTLPGRPRVVFCANAVSRMREELDRAFGLHSDNGRLAAAFARLVLLHEHFHALVSEGLDTKRARRPRYADAHAWSAGTTANEALAAWFELHHVRGDRELSDFVRAYIRRGRFPEWPYAGADQIERLFGEGGIDVVRGLVGALRDAPGETAAKLGASISAACKSRRTSTTTASL